VVFGGAYSTLRREGAVVVGGDILIDNGGGDEEIGKVGRGLIVKEEVGERVRESFKKGDNRSEGRDVGGGGSRAKRGEVDISTVRDD
jgi:hypothetical protein